MDTADKKKEHIYATIIILYIHILKLSQLIFITIIYYSSSSSRAMETAGLVASGPASTSGPLSITSQEEGTLEPDPNATYASVSYEIAVVYLIIYTGIFFPPRSAMSFYCWLNLSRNVYCP